MTTEDLTVPEAFQPPQEAADTSEDTGFKPTRKEGVYHLNRGELGGSHIGVWHPDATPENESRHEATQKLLDNILSGRFVELTCIGTATVGGPVSLTNIPAHVLFARTDRATDSIWRIRPELYRYFIDRDVKPYAAIPADPGPVDENLQIIVFVDAANEIYGFVMPMIEDPEVDDDSQQKFDSWRANADQPDEGLGVIKDMPLRTLVTYLRDEEDEPLERAQTFDPVEIDGSPAVVVAWKGAYGNPVKVGWIATYTFIGRAELARDWSTRKLQSSSPPPRPAVNLDNMKKALSDPHIRHTWEAAMAVASTYEENNLAGFALGLTHGLLGHRIWFSHEFMDGYRESDQDARMADGWMIGNMMSQFAFETTPDGTITTTGGILRFLENPEYDETQTAEQYIASCEAEAAEDAKKEESE